MMYHKDPEVFVKRSTMFMVLDVSSFSYLDVCEPIFMYFPTLPVSPTLVSGHCLEGAPWPLPTPRNMQ